MSTESKKCAMDSCLCSVSGGQKYCSPYCETAKDATKLQCDCGHPSCDSQKL